MIDCHLPWHFVLHELPMAQGWALIAWRVENDPWGNAQRSGSGYIAQEIERLLRDTN